VRAKIAVVSESFLPQINGVTNSVIRVLETFKQRELQAMVIAPTSPSPQHLGFEVKTTPFLPLMQFPVAMPTPGVWRALDEFKPSVIHVAAPFLLGAQAIAWAVRNEVPTVAVYQTDVSGYLERYNASFAKPVMDLITFSIHERATLNLAPTKLSAEYLRSLGLSNVKIWGRGVDQDLFNPSNKSSDRVRQLKCEIAPDGQTIIGFVGRLAAEKQVHRMLELLDLPNAKFLVVGDGPQRQELEQLFGDRVLFTGALTGMELAHHYAALDIFVHFGTEETFGQTIQEAKASGVAVVAPNVGGPKELIEHGVSGLLVDPAEKLGYLAAVTRLLDPAFRNEVSSNAHRSVSDKSWAKNNALLLDYYREAMAEVHSRRAAQFELA
jgi:phosphatidylinositol alpha 1,6-mannosyltransferase